jgi:hypothetical protein
MEFREQAMLLRLTRQDEWRVLARAGVICCTSALAALASPLAAGAQETRAAEIAKKQEEKASALAPYTPTRFEVIMNQIEQNFASPPDGFFPALDSVYSGGGFTLGVGYRRFYARKAVWDITGLYSIKNYKKIEVGTRTPWNFDGRWTLGARVGWLDAPQVGFYGLGMSSDTDDRANFRLQQGYAGATATFEPTPWTRLEADVAYEDYETEEGQGSAPSIETRYDATEAPGLFADPAYIRTQGTAAIDWRTSPGYSRKGGYYGVTLVNFDDVDEIYSFRRLDGEIIQHLPILRENWVISLRGRVQTTLDDDDVVPYFLLPWLGSGRTLRGYSTGRFRDRHSILTSAEIRWIPNRVALDMAVFYDAGKVTSRRKDLDFNGLESNWGLGARFHAFTATFLRIEAARGSDGWHLVFATSAAF